MLALARGDKGHALVTMLEERDGDRVANGKSPFDQPGYLGSMAGGFLAGEDQLSLLVK